MMLGKDKTKDLHMRMTVVVMSVLTGAMSLSALAELGGVQAVSAREELFPLTRVRLTAGPLQVQQEQVRKYLLRLDVDRLLSRFRLEAGLQPKAECYPGWEDPKPLDLAGHILGFYMSGASMMVEATGDEELKRRLLYIVDELEAVQDAHGDGYALAVKDGRKVFAEIASGDIRVRPKEKTKYAARINNRFEPIYTMNKILIGLYRVYVATGSEKAKRAFLRLSDWFGNGIVDKLDDVQVQTILDCEHGSLPESFVEAYLLTGDEKYRRWARRLCHERILAPLAAGDMTYLDYHHSNNEIPKFTGFERVYRISGEKRLHSAIANAWKCYATRHVMANGGTSHKEHLFPPEEAESKLCIKGGPESCNSVNMLRQTAALFQTEPSADKVELYERVLFDHLLSTHDPLRGRTVFYTLINPGLIRPYAWEFDSMHCCVGTGFEAPGAYALMVYTHSPDNSSVSVQLFAPSMLNWSERGVRLRQETAFPYGESSCVKVDAVGEDADFTIRVRRPAWAGERFAMYVNGSPVDASVDAVPGYVDVKRVWKKGDRLDVEFPMSLSAERMRGSKKYVAFYYGPTLLVADLGDRGIAKDDMFGMPWGEAPKEWLANPLKSMPVVPSSAVEDPSSCLERTTGGAIAFHLVGTDILLKPMYDLHFSRYSMYFKLADAVE